MNWLQKMAAFVYGDGDTVVAYQGRIFLIDFDAFEDDPTFRKMMDFFGL